jgi:glycosyltransferase involved in cell wall biosynthesis
MRFCFLMPQIEQYSPVSGGAIATVTAHVARDLQWRGHRVDVVGADCYEPVYGDGDFHPVRFRSAVAVSQIAAHLEARLRGWDLPDEGRFDTESLKILARLRPDVVVLANEFDRISRVRRLFPNVRIAVWVHNECRLRGGTPEVLRLANTFLCCSHYIRNWMLRRHPLNPAIVHTAYAGVDREVFYPAPWDAPPEELRVLFTGRLDPNKGVDVAVAAVSRLRKRGIRIRLCVAGNAWFYAHRGLDKDPFQKRLRSAMCEGNVDWLGHVPRRFLPDVMRRHDVALVPSRSEEPFGLVVLESMASGLAVVASPRGGLPEACGNAATIVDPEDLTQMEQALTRFSTDPSNLSEWKRRSLGRVQTVDWSSTAEVLCRAVETQDIE